MKNYLAKQLIAAGATILIKMLTAEKVAQFGRMAIDWAREYVLGTASDIDDTLVLPALDSIEAGLGMLDQEPEK